MVKFREVSDSVWVGFEAVITEKTIKEERTNNNNYYDNYNLVYSDTMIITNYILLTASLFVLFTYLKLNEISIAAI